MAAKGSEGSSGRGHLGVVTTGVALGLVLIYVVFVTLQWSDSDTSATLWSRHQELLTGLEALAFTAAGALLGTTVQRQATQQAEGRADRAEAAAARDSRDAEKGRALQRALESRSAVRGTGTSDPMRSGAPAGAADNLADLVELARRYDEAG